VDYVRYASHFNRCDVWITSSDDKTLEIDADYAKELNKNLLKRLEIA
jgi:hypothetical protein